MSKIGISILHNKNVKLTINCLKSLQRQTYKDFIIYLLIQGSSREDEITLTNLYSKWDNLIIDTAAENKGFAEGNNINIRKALTDKNIKYILTLNNDIIFQENFLKNLINHAEQTNSDMIQATMLKMDKPNEIDSLGIEFMMSGITFNIKSHDKILFCPSAGAALYSRKLLEQTKEEKQISIGFESRIIYDYFDSSFFAYAEDFDLGFRARLLGFSASLANDAICWHKGSATTGVMSDFAVYHTYRNLIFTLYKNLPTKLWWQYSLLILMGQAIIKINSIKRHQLKVYISAIYNALKDLKKYKNKRFYIQSKKIADIRPFITKKIIDTDYIIQKNLSK